MLNKDQQHRLDVASFVIWECDKAKHPITNLSCSGFCICYTGIFGADIRKSSFQHTLLRGSWDL